MKAVPLTSVLTYLCTHEGVDGKSSPSSAFAGRRLTRVTNHVGINLVGNLGMASRHL